MNARTGPAVRRWLTSTRPSLVRELLLVAALFLVYKAGRQLADGRPGAAFADARGVWHLERAVHLPSETTVQGWLLHSDTLIHLANTYYATVHFPATVLFLAWLYWRRPRHYLWARRVLTLVTAAALVLHLTLPLAPPRLLAATGLVDTARLYGPSVYGSSPTSDTLANQFAAMPSLHFGWALMVAVGLIVATRSRLRWLWLLHPLFTLFVIVSTANHYWLDTIVAAALLAGALAVVRIPPSRSLVVRTSVPESSVVDGQAAENGESGVLAPVPPGGRRCARAVRRRERCTAGGSHRRTPARLAGAGGRRARRVAGTAGQRAATTNERSGR